MEDRLHKFAVLVDHGSFTKAAAVLHVSQPALSTAIQKLERELKAELLVRGSRELQLTAAGQVAYSAAKDLLIRTANLRQHLSELSAERAALRIGMIDSLAEMLISHEDVFGALRSRAQVALSIDNSARLLKSLEHDALDIAFVARQAGRLPPTLDGRLELGDEPLIVVTHPAILPTVRQALQSKVVPQFLSYNQQATTQQLIQRALAEQGIEVQASFYSTSPDILLKLTINQQGVSALPYRMVAAHIAEGSLVQVPHIAIINRPVVAVVRSGKRLTLASVELCEQLRQLLYTNQIQASTASQAARKPKKSATDSRAGAQHLPQ